MRWWSFALVATCFVIVSPARADVRRFAVLIGNNRGYADDATLRYAEADAQKVAGVLRDLGGFEPADTLVLLGESGATVRRALITVNDRVRAAQALPNTETLLFVYYSGHADANGLRLGSSRFELAEIAELVRGSAAKFRILTLDACRSGALTRVKGARPVPAFAVGSGGGLGGEGMAFLTASSANEDAQESDELKSSFFTHAFVSGLLGAADLDRDGAVLLEEAYRYAYDATLRATSRTFAGVQHPTFRFDVRGQESLVLTRPGAAAGTRARLSFPTGIGFLVLSGGAQGPVVGEISAGDRARTLSLRPGRYFVRGRGIDVLFEGSVDLRAAQSHTVDTSTLNRVAYARLVRKGARDSDLAHALEFGPAVRTELPNAETLCWGGVLGYRLALESISLAARASACTSSFENAAVAARTNEYALDAGAEHVFDFTELGLGLELGAGASFTHQSFDTRGVAPDRVSTSPFAYAAVRVTREIGKRFFAGLDARGEAHLIELQERAPVEAQSEVALAMRGVLMGGAQF